MNKTHTQKQNKDLWATPWYVVKFAEQHFGLTFDLDVCALPHNSKAEHFITPEQDTLKTDWQGKDCWFNPPYSNPLPFVQRAIEQARDHNKNVVMLLNVDNSTRWFSLIARNAFKIVFITDGRIGFISEETGKAVNGNNKGQMLVYFNSLSIADPNIIPDLSPITEYISIHEIKAIGNSFIQ